MGHALGLALTLLTVLCLPVIVAMLICADEWGPRRGRRADARRDRRILRRLDRTLRPDVPRQPSGDRAQPTIEQIAADLRRLHRQRSAGPTTESTAWLLAVRRAYDDRLRLACTCLGVTEHPGELEGLDREIERVRVEGELEAAGLVLRTNADHQPPDRLG